MKKALKRNFIVNETVFVVDYWGTGEGTQAFGTRAEIVKVDKKNKTITAVLYGDTYQVYSKHDFGRIIFDTADEANEVAKNLPTPKTTMFQRIGKKVFKKKVLGIIGEYIDGTYDLAVSFDRGKNIPIREIGRSLFLEETDARK